jgi:hypothetical protein
MFELPVWQLSVTVRGLAEAVATFGLLLTIFGCVSRKPDIIAQLVGMLTAVALGRWLWHKDV